MVVVVVVVLWTLLGWGRFGVGRGGRVVGLQGWDVLFGMQNNAREKSTTVYLGLDHDLNAQALQSDWCI